MSLFSDRFTQGGQTQLHQLRMIKQVIGSTLKISFLFFLISFGLLIFKDHIWQDFWLLLCYGKAFLRIEHMSFLPLGFFDSSYIFYDNGSTEWLTDRHLLHHDKIQVFVFAVLFSMLKKLSQSVLLTFIAMIGICFFWYYRGKQNQSSKVLDGFEVVNAKKLLKIIQKQGSSSYKIGNVLLPKGAEFQHMMVTGTTGSGKSNMIHHLLKQIREQGDQAIIVDTTGGIVSRFYDESKDLILNPLDERSQLWNMWRECIYKNDFDELAETVLSSNTHDQFWIDAARQLFSETAHLFSHMENPKLKSLLKLLLEEPLQKIQPILKKTQAYSLMDPAIEKTALSIRVTMMTHLRSFFNLGEDGHFSINQWVQNPEFNQFLFLSCKPDQRELLKPLITTWTGLSIKALMKLSENNNRRIWLIIDELASLQKLPSLMTALTEIRKYGGCMVLGFQNLALIEKIYDKATVRAISDLTGTKVIFRSLDPDSAKTMSRFLGEQEIIEASESVSFGAHQMRDGVSLGTQKKTKQVVNPTEIMQLKDLECFMKFKGDLPPSKYEFSYLKMDQKALSFIPKSEKKQDEGQFDVESLENLLRMVNGEKTLDGEIKEQYNKILMEEIVNDFKEIP